MEDLSNNIMVRIDF